MSKYEAVYFVGDNQAINRVGVLSSKTGNRGAFLGLLAALIQTFYYLNKISLSQPFWIIEAVMYLTYTGSTYTDPTVYV